MINREIQKFISSKVEDYKENYLRIIKTAKDSRDAQYQIEMALMVLCGEIAEEQERQNKLALKGELLPIEQATSEWLRVHEYADEIESRVDEEYGVKREIPFKAIYFSPIHKFQSVMKDNINK